MLSNNIKIRRKEKWEGVFTVAAISFILGALLVLIASAQEFIPEALANIFTLVFLVGWLLCRVISLMLTDSLKKDYYAEYLRIKKRSI